MISKWGLIMNTDNRVLRETYEIVKISMDDLVGRFCRVASQGGIRWEQIFGHIKQQNLSVRVLEGLEILIEDAGDLQAFKTKLKRLSHPFFKLGLSNEDCGFLGRCILHVLGDFFGSKWTQEVSLQWQELIHTIVHFLDEERMALLQVATIEQRSQVRPTQSNQQAMLTMTVPFTLPQDVKDSIRRVVRENLKEMLIKEIEHSYREELQLIMQSNPEELVRNALAT